ncbi:MAG: hypothetical protein JXJ22_14695 [Bacteroidales bacterium]|nr:hypothetical protein [Bacteroidales bacterium]
MEKNKSNANIIIGLILGIIITVTITQLIKKTSSFEKSMNKAASELSEKCPIMVDRQTRLDNVIVMPENTLQYKYALVNWLNDSIDVQTFEKNMKTILLNHVKTSPDLKMYRDNNVTMEYNYRDKQGVFVLKISITSDQYLKE